MSVKTSTTSNGTIGILDIRGSLIGDGDTEVLHAAVVDFMEQGIRRVIIDLHRLNYLNSTGIGAIIRAHSTARKNNGDVRLTGLSDNVQSVLAITRLIDVFEVYDSLPEAVNSFDNMTTT